MNRRLSKCWFTFDIFDKVIFDHLTKVLFNWVVINKEKKVELDRKCDMNIIIHDITYKMNVKREL